MILMILTHADLMDTVSAAEYAALHGVCRQRIWQLYHNNGGESRILGARLEGAKNLRIPRKAPYPEDTRKTWRKKAKEEA